nr:DUF2280 domain-containing protein [Dickeya zeae]
MAALPTEVKAFIVQSLACYESPAKIIELVKEDSASNHLSKRPIT